MSASFRIFASSSWRTAVMASSDRPWLSKNACFSASVFAAAYSARRSSSIDSRTRKFARFSCPMSVLPLVFVCQADVGHELFESRIAAQEIPTRIDFQITNFRIAPSRRDRQPAQRRLGLPESAVDRRDAAGQSLAGLFVALLHGLGDLGGFIASACRR